MLPKEKNYFLTVFLAFGSAEVFGVLAFFAFTSLTTS
jgi:hypothetical protein